MTPSLFDLRVGQVYRDLQDERYRRIRDVEILSLSDSGDFAYVVATPSGRKTRIHRDTLRRRFRLVRNG